MALPYFVVPFKITWWWITFNLPCTQCTVDYLQINITASADNSAAVLFHLKSKNPPLHCVRFGNADILREPGQASYLGVFHDPTLTFRLHITHIVINMNNAFHGLYPMLTRGSSLDLAMTYMMLVWTKLAIIDDRWCFGPFHPDLHRSSLEDTLHPYISRINKVWLRMLHGWSSIILSIRTCVEFMDMFIESHSRKKFHVAKYHYNLLIAKHLQYSPFDT